MYRGKNILAILAVLTVVLTGMYAFEVFTGNSDAAVGNIIRPLDEEKNPGLLEYKVLDESESPFKVEVSFCYPLGDGTSISIDVPDYFEYESQQYEVVRIGNGAFKNRTNLSSITLPETVYEIGDEAFYRCSNLSGVDGPSVEHIGARAFYKCTSLRSLTMKYLESVGDESFYGCSILSSLLVRSLESIGDSAFYDCVKLDDLVANEIRIIGAYSFYNCKSLTDISAIIAYVDEIPDYAFSKSGVYKTGRSLQQLEIPADITRVGDYAFYDCDSLTKVVFKATKATPDLSVGTRAFSECGNLTTIQFSKNLKSTGNCIILDSNKVSSLSIASGGIYRVVDNALIRTDSESAATLVCYARASAATSYDVPDDVTSISAYAFYNSTKLTTINLGEKVSEIGTHAFTYCSALTSFTVDAANQSFKADIALYKAVNENGTMVPKSIFAMPNGYDGDLTLLDGITSIDARAFYASKITGVSIPNTVTTIGTEAFRGCTNIDSLGYKVDWSL